MHKELQKFIRFCLVGATNAAIDIGLFNILLSLKLNPYLAGSLSFVVAATNGYILNRAWTFKEQKSQRVARQYFFFLFISTIGLGFNNLILYLTLQHLDLDNPVLTANIGKILAVGIVVFWNYSMNRFFVFRTNDAASSPANL